MSVSLTKSKDLVANTISVTYKYRAIDLKDLFLSNLHATTSIVGLQVETVDSLHNLAEAINSDANFV